MKALSVRQPWADMIADGVKRIEVRSWSTTHRGPLLICASRHGHHPHRGVAVCVVDLSDCRPLTPDDAPLSASEYREGLFAWVLTNPRPCEQRPVRGRLGVFEITS